jgi:hypothetical protein
MASRIGRQQDRRGANASRKAVDLDGSQDRSRPVPPSTLGHTAVLMAGCRGGQVHSDRGWRPTADRRFGAVLSGLRRHGQETQAALQARYHFRQLLGL